MNVMKDWALQNQDLLKDMAENAIYAILILFIGHHVGKGISRLIEKSRFTKKLDRTVSSFLGSLFYGFTFVVSIIMALGVLGVQTTSMVAILGAAGLAIGLALKDSLNNFASGIMIVTFRPFSANDFVEMAGVSGKVERITLFMTHVLTPDNKVIFIPNGNIINGAIINYSRQSKRRVDHVIGISYESDLRKAKQILVDIINSKELIHQEPAPLVAVSALADSSVNFNVRVWTNNDDFWPVYYDLLETIKIEFDKEGIGIPFPQMDVHLHKQDN